MEGKDVVEDVIELMDSYYLTRDDWDNISELGVGYAEQTRLKVEPAAKAAFTRTWNQKPHAMPFMKASEVIAPKNLKKIKPDLEEAFEESDENDAAFHGSDVDAQEDEEEPLDLKKDKFVKVPKAKPVTAKQPAGKKTGAKGKGGEDEDGAESQEDVKPKNKKRGKRGGQGKRKKKSAPEV